MSVRKKSYQIKLDVDPVTYETYHSLTDRQKRNLKRLMKIIILATRDEDFADVLKISSEVNLSDDTKEFIKEVAKGSGDVEELAREAVAFIEFLLNAASLSRGSCELIEVNKTKALLLVERAKKILS